mmetsp:Transcript_24203/g.53323  ORF Transcript_24203/g.53323 Transcript_24203/m.53323 type:complete len:225 (-) Transcript_24203:289-963(-)
MDSGLSANSRSHSFNSPFRYLYMIFGGSDLSSSLSFSLSSLAFSLSLVSFSLSKDRAFSEDRSSPMPKPDICCWSCRWSCFNFLFCARNGLRIPCPFPSRNSSSSDRPSKVLDCCSRAFFSRSRRTVFPSPKYRITSPSCRSFRVTEAGEVSKSFSFVGGGRDEVGETGDDSFVCESVDDLFSPFVVEGSLSFSLRFSLQSDFFDDEDCDIVAECFFFDRLFCC